MGTKRIYHINLVGVSSVSDKMGKGTYKSRGKTQAKFGKPVEKDAKKPVDPGKKPTDPGKGQEKKEQDKAPAKKQEEKKKGSGKP